MRKVNLFDGLDEQNLNIVAGFLKEARETSGTVLAQEGQVGQSFFVIVEGVVRIERAGHVIRSLEAGAYFGEISLLDGQTRTVTAVADTDIRCLRIDRGQFDYLLHHYPQIVRGLLTALCGYLRVAEARLNEGFWLEAKRETP